MKLLLVLLLIAVLFEEAHSRFWHQDNWLPFDKFETDGLYSSFLDYSIQDVLSFVGISLHDYGNSCVSRGRWYKELGTTMFRAAPPDETYEKRLENCFTYVPSTGKAYLIGGANGIFDIDIFDVATRKWSSVPGPGISLHHSQCVVVDSKIWIVSAWTGDCCEEESLDQIWVYDPTNNTWDTSRQAMPADRRRGAAATVYDGDNLIYVSHGNPGGHSGQVSAMLDVYNIASDVWVALPSANFPRDHTGGGLVNGKVCVAGGRSSTDIKVTVKETECYDPTTMSWSTEAAIPGTGRSGALYATTCDGHLMVAGGEWNIMAENDVAVFDGTNWEALLPMRMGRHATGIAYVPECNQAIVAGGANVDGGKYTVDSTDIFYADSYKALSNVELRVILGDLFSCGDS